MADPLPPLAPSGNPAFPLQSADTLRLDFTDAQVDEYREQDRFLPVSY